jgi:predicted MFS family arabinose efflux permease
VLTIFVCAHTLLSVDRGVMAILLEPIKRDLKLSDSQLGLLTGFGFALFFGVAGIPIGWLVDRINRRNILAAAVFTFSAMTALAAATTGFLQILATRSIVGAGEAGGGPAMGSMLADLYPPARRASALAIYYLGAPLGAILAFLVGGWAAGHFGWRTVFLIAGLPGMLLALILWLTVAEPVRRGDGQSGEAGAAPSLRETIRFILRQRALCHVLVTPILTSSASAGVFTFAASYFIRSHGLSLPQVGLLLAVFYGSAGVIGSVAGGRIVDRLARRDERWRAWYCGLANALAAPAVMLMTLAPSLPLAVAGLILFAMLTMSTYGPLLAMIQTLVAARMRGTVTAIFYLLSYLLGAASGPQIVGLASDLLRPRFGAESLRYAMLCMMLLYLWGALHFLFAGQRLPKNLADVPS